MKQQYYDIACHEQHICHLFNVTNGRSVVMSNTTAAICCWIPEMVSSGEKQMGADLHATIHLHSTA